MGVKREKRLFPDFVEAKTLPNFSFKLWSQTTISILLKNPHFLFLIDAKNALDSNMKVARDKFSSTLVLTRENKLLLALKRGSESAFSSERRAD
jgi:hypothetical protein